MNINKTIGTLALTLGATLSSQAALISLDLSPKDADGNGTGSVGDSTVRGTSSHSGSVTSATSLIQVLNDGGGIASTRNAGTYAVTVSGLAFDTFTNVTLTFDLAVTASAGDGISIYRHSDGWNVDADQNGLNEARRLNSGETITFSVDNLVASGAGGPLAASFDAFSGANFSIQGSAVGSFDPLTGVATSTGGDTTNGSNLQGVQFDVNIVAVPEPTSSCFIAISGIALLVRRKR